MFGTAFRKLPLEEHEDRFVTRSAALCESTNHIRRKRAPKRPSLLATEGLMRRLLVAPVSREGIR